MKAHKTETLGSIGIDDVKKVLLKHNLTIADNFHMNNFFEAELVHTTDNKPYCIYDNDVKLTEKGKLVTNKKHGLFITNYNHKQGKAKTFAKSVAQVL